MTMNLEKVVLPIAPLLSISMTSSSSAFSAIRQFIEECAELHQCFASLEFDKHCCNRKDGKASEELCQLMQKAASLYRKVLMPLFRIRADLDTLREKVHFSTDMTQVVSGDPAIEKLVTKLKVLVIDCEILRDKMADYYHDACRFHTRRCILEERISLFRQAFFCFFPRPNKLPLREYDSLEFHNELLRLESAGFWATKLLELLQAYAPGIVCIAERTIALGQAPGNGSASYYG